MNICKHPPPWQREQTLCTPKRCLLATSHSKGHICTMHPYRHNASSLGTEVSAVPEYEMWAHPCRNQRRSGRAVHGAYKHSTSNWKLTTSRVMGGCLNMVTLILVSTVGKLWERSPFSGTHAAEVSPGTSFRIHLPETIQPRINSIVSWPKQLRFQIRPYHIQPPDSKGCYPEKLTQGIACLLLIFHD